MHLLLVGPGALGCLLSTIISRGLADGDRLTLLDHDAERADYLDAEGIVYHLADKLERIPVTTMSDPHRLDSVDVILFCVKSYDLLSSLEYCQELLTEGRLVIFLQNGISHLELGPHLRKASTAFGTTTEGATLLGKGQVRHAGRGVTFLGYLNNLPKHCSMMLQKPGIL